jgi:hypothetical protein
MKTYRVWISGQKAETLVVRQFESAIAARLWIAAFYGLKTYDAVAQRVPHQMSDEERVALCQDIAKQL